MELEEGQHEARRRPDRLEKELRMQVQLMEELQQSLTHHVREEELEQLHAVSKDI